MQKTETKFTANSDLISYAQTSTFVNNMQLPIHRWLRFSAGFSAAWARQTIIRFKNSDSFTVLDPFAGCGTTVLAAEECCSKAIGVDANPFFTRIAKAKLQWRSSAEAFESFTLQMLDNAKHLPNANTYYPKLISKCYSEESCQALDKLRRAWITLDDKSPASELAWLALVCILRSTSFVGTSPWTYILPRHSKKKIVRPFDAFFHQSKMMLDDIKYYQSSFPDSPIGLFYLDDARKCATIADNSIDLVITSPPYANNFDYAGAVRLEMSFLGEVTKWSDLHTKIRRYLVRSCSHHMSNNDNLSVLLNNKKLKPIVNELEIACRRLSEEKEHHGGRKRYDLMVAAYFSDLAEVWSSLRRVCKQDAKVCFVIGDSGPYGVHIPVDRWLGELAISAGFKSYNFEKTRDRNIKWAVKKKHKVPLHEGRLWVEG